MAVDPSLESFAFALFQKLWIRNGLPDFAEVDPDYPAIGDFACPDDFCDTVYAFQCLSSSFYEDFCDVYYNSFAVSRSDFRNFLCQFVTMLDSLRPTFELASISLATLAVEMGLACARRDNFIFVFTCPLAFAMVFEESLGSYFYLDRAETAINELCERGSKFRNLRDIARIAGRSASLRRTLVHELQMLCYDLKGNESAEHYCQLLELTVKLGGTFDLPGVIQDVSLKSFQSAVFFPVYVELICHEQFNVFLSQLNTRNLHTRYKDSRMFFILDIAFACSLNEEKGETFVALYEETVLKEKVVIPLYLEMTHDYSDKHEVADISEDPSKSNSHPSSLQPKYIESRVRFTDNEHDSLRILYRIEELSETSSVTPSVEDLKPNDTSFDARSSVLQCSTKNSSETTSEACDEPSTIVGTEPSFIQSSSRTSLTTLPKVCDEPSTTVNFKGDAPFETYRNDTKLECVEEFLNTSVQRIQKRPLDYVKPHPCQSLKAHQYTFGASWERFSIYTEGYKTFFAKIAKFVLSCLFLNPSYKLFVLCQPIEGFGIKRLNECKSTQKHTIENQADGFQFTKDDDDCTELRERPLPCGSASTISRVKDLEQCHAQCLDKKTSIETFQPTPDSGVCTGKQALLNQPSNVTEESLQTSFNLNSCEERHSAFSVGTSRKFSSVSEISRAVDDSVTTNSSEIEDVQGNHLIKSHFMKGEDHSLPVKDLTSSLDIFSELRLKSESPMSRNTPEISKLPKNSSASELKHHEIAIDTNASPKLGNKEISLGTTAMDLRDPVTSDDISSSQIKDHVVSTDTNTSNLGNREEFLDATKRFHTSNHILEDTSVSKFSEMDISLYSQVSQNIVERTNSALEHFELDSHKSTVSTPEDCLKSKRVVETDNFVDLKITVYFSPEIKTPSEYVNCGNFSTLCEDHSGEACSDYGASNENLSLVTSMDETNLFDNCQAPVPDIFSEQYLKLDNGKAFEESNAFRAFEEEITHKNSLNKENVFEETLTREESEHSPLQLKDVWSIKQTNHISAEIGTFSETSEDRNVQMNLNNEELNTQNSKDEDGSCKHQSVQIPSSLKPNSKVSTEKMDSDSDAQKEANMKSPLQQISPTEDKEPKSSLPEDDCDNLIKDMSGTAIKDKDNSGTKKQKTRRKNKKQATGKATEGLEDNESRLPQKCINRNVEPDVHQMILVMGVPFEKTIERDMQIMKRITIKSF